MTCKADRNVWELPFCSFGFEGGGGSCTGGTAAEERGGSSTQKGHEEQGQGMSTCLEPVSEVLKCTRDNVRRLQKEDPVLKPPNSWETSGIKTKSYI